MPRIKIDLPKVLFIITFLFWAVMAVKPLNRFDWFLENIVVFLAAPLAIWSYFKFRFSNFSYILIFILGILHIAASHYAYLNTPWGNWLSLVFGWQRNHYDRIVHFLYGFLMAPVAEEILRKYIANTAVRLVSVFAVLIAIGALYEVAEFIVGIITKPEAGLAFLGFQGDIWDTQKDMALQGLGVILGILIFWRKFK